MACNTFQLDEGVAWLSEIRIDERRDLASSAALQEASAPPFAGGLGDQSVVCDALLVWSNRLMLSSSRREGGRVGTVKASYALAITDADVKSRWYLVDADDYRHETG